MRVVLDSNVFISALMSLRRPPARLYTAWQSGRFSLITSRAQLDELERVLRYERLQRFFKREQAHRLMMALRNEAVILESLPDLAISPDPTDNLILATAVAAEANLLVSSDKKHLLALVSVHGIPIVTPEAALQALSKES